VRLVHRGAAIRITAARGDAQSDARRTVPRRVHHAP